MVVAFHCSCSMNVIKSYKARTINGKSFAFLLLVFNGCICCFTSKLMELSCKQYGTYDVLSKKQRMMAHGCFCP